MALALNRKVTNRALVDSRIMSMGTKLSHEYIDSLRAKNDTVWRDRKSWFLCFYFGQGDDRLWVPRKIHGQPHAERRVINFSHAQGKQAAQVLLLSYLIGTIGVVVVASIAFGYRW